MATASWQHSVPDSGYVELQIKDGELEVTGHTPGLPAPDLQAAIREAAYQQVQIPRNDEAALYRYARRQGLGAPLSPEYTINYLSIDYVCQAFAMAIACCPAGQWDKVSSLSW